MTKGKARSYFLYSFFVAVIAVHLVSFEKEAFFVIVWVFAGTIAFAFLTKDLLGQVVSVSASIIIFAFIFQFMSVVRTSEVSFATLVYNFYYSAVYNIGSALAYYVLRVFFEYLFDTKEWNG